MKFGLFRQKVAIILMNFWKKHYLEKSLVLIGFG